MNLISRTFLNYKIISIIGEGGMGTVYLGTHITLGRKAAIKVLLPELTHNQQIKDRFINEAKTLSKLNHQNIVTLYDFADVNGNLLLVMEFVEGTPLDIVIEKITGPIPEPRCINIFNQILSGFAYAHNEGIIHRDIKPSNIILGKDDFPKILDFGIAKIVEGNARLTKTGTKMGSVLYMSPEQVLGRETDFRSDIYSLGVTLYEMLSGKLPYDSMTESEYEIQTRIVKEPLIPIHSLNLNVSEKVGNAISIATAKNVMDRFQSCDEFKEALRSSDYSNRTTTITPNYNKTIYQVPNIGTQNSSKVPHKQLNKAWIFTLGSILIITLIIIIYLFLHNNKEEVVEKNTLNSKYSENINNNNYPKNIEGYYIGTINGSKWEIHISNFDGKRFVGYNTVYWPSKTLSTKFTGDYDLTIGKIVMYEESGKGSGKFEGVFSNNGLNITGGWHRYSDNGYFDWSLEKQNNNNNQENNVDPNDIGKYPEASRRLLNQSELANLSKWDLKIMRNEIYARHGYIFKTDDMRNYFINQNWYRGNYDNVDNMLTQTEKDNIELIKKYEQIN